MAHPSVADMFQRPSGELAAESPFSLLMAHAARAGAALLFALHKLEDGKPPLPQSHRALRSGGFGSLSGLPLHSKL